MKCSKCNEPIDLKYTKDRETGMHSNYWWCEYCGRVLPQIECNLADGFTFILENGTEATLTHDGFKTKK